MAAPMFLLAGGAGTIALFYRAQVLEDEHAAWEKENLDEDDDSVAPNFGGLDTFFLRFAGVFAAVITVGGTIAMLSVGSTMAAKANDQYKRLEKGLNDHKPVEVTVAPVLSQKCGGVVVTLVF